MPNKFKLIHIGFYKILQKSRTLNFTHNNVRIKKTFFGLCFLLFTDISHASSIPDDLLYENGHICFNPINKNIFKGWNNLPICNNVSSIKVAGKFNCREDELVFFNYVYNFKKLIDSVSLSGGQRIIIYKNNKYFAEVYLNTPPRYDIKVDRLGNAFFKVQSKGATLEKVSFCKSENLTEDFRLGGDFYKIRR